MTAYTIYNKENGEIASTVKCSKDAIEEELKENQSYIHGDYNDAEYYIDLTTISPKEKPTIPININKKTLQADEKDQIVMSNLPISTRIEVRRTFYHVDDGIFEFSTDTAGKYDIVCEATNYLPQKIEVEAYD